LNSPERVYSAGLIFLFFEPLIVIVMHISKFKLIRGGLDGVVISAIEPIPCKGNMLILDEVQRTRKVTLSSELREKIQNLKYFYLNLTSHWIPPYNKYFDLNKYVPNIVDTTAEMPQGQTLLHDIWNHTEITGVSVTDHGFVITGAIETVELKKIGIVTPYITEEDDVSFFITAMDKINEIMKDLVFNLENNMLPAHESKETLMALNIPTEEKMTEDEVLEKVINRLMDRGAVILMDDSGSPQKEIQEKSEGKSEKKTKVHTNTKSIDSHNMPDAVETTEKTTEEANEEKNGTPTPEVIRKPSSSTLASEKGFPDLSGDRPSPNEGSQEFIPDGGSLEHLEFSDNMGISQEVGPDDYPSSPEDLDE
jgi:hypothetical protein